MARRPATTESAIRLMLRHMEKSGCYTQMTMETYRKHTTNVMHLINANIDQDATPMNMTSDTVLRFHSWMRRAGYTPNTQKSYLKILKQMCDYVGNRCFSQINIVHDQDTRPYVDWLTLLDAERILDYPMDEFESMVIWLGLCHGLRRIEITRMLVSDIDMERGTIMVRGKGRGSGKMRTIYIHPNFRPIYVKWMMHRAELCKGATWTSDRMLIYRKGPNAREYTTTTIGQKTTRLSNRIGIKFTLHTLRRTFGRELYHSGVNIVTISAILGHESITMTMKYIGVNLDDMATAMSKFSLGKR